jgi:hypothetical protein
VSIVQTTQHALYITKTWYAHFNRVVARNNDGNGITLDRDRDKNLAKGPVNFVTFFECKSSSNGQKAAYNGEDVYDVGYGLGSFGCNTVINVLACSFENNGGPGIYLADHPVTWLVQGCYIEHNSRAIDRAFKAKYGEDFWTKKDREPMGRRADLVEDCGSGPWSVTFDTCYFHDSGGIWLRGQGRNNPIEFRRIVQPSVIWSEHGNWVLVDSQKPPVARNAGIIFRPEGGGYEWYDPDGGGPGHPGYVMDGGVRRLYPYAKTGMDFHVRIPPDEADKEGLTLQDLASMLSNTRVDTPVRIYGDAHGIEIPSNHRLRFELENVSGSGVIELHWARGDVLVEGKATNVTCGLVLNAQHGYGGLERLHLRRCPDVRILGAEICAKDALGAVVCEGSTGAVIEKCLFVRARRAEDLAFNVRATGNSRVFVRGYSPGGAYALVALEGGSIIASPVPPARRAREPETLGNVTFIDE